ncbi:hypothetical protein J6590_090791 [Homalodisca vitripennis]|nr:hypothetical protein J6590_090791 [Homalodisca vitripennis]
MLIFVPGTLYGGIDRRLLLGGMLEHGTPRVPVVCTKHSQRHQKGLITAFCFALYNSLPV